MMIDIDARKTFTGSTQMLTRDLFAAANLVNCTVVPKEVECMVKRQSSIRLRVDLHSFC